MEGNIDFVLRHPSTEGGKKWKYAIVIQGDYRSQTPNAVKELIERNTEDDTLFIFSTYAPDQERSGQTPYGSFLSGFEKDQISKGRIIYIFIRPPDRDQYPIFWQTNFINQNLHRFSSFMGVNLAHELEIPLTLKIRSDAFFGVRNICKYLDEISVEIPIIDPEGFCNSNGKLHRRLVVSDHSKHPSIYVGDYHIYDHWLFGQSEDLLYFYDIRPGTPWRDGAGNTKEFVSCINVESNMTELWMRRLDIPFSSIKNLCELSARYLYVASTLEVEFVWQKLPGHEKYYHVGKDFQRQYFIEENKFHNFLAKERWLGYVKQLAEEQHPSLTIKEPQIKLSIF